MHFSLVFDQHPSGRWSALVAEFPHLVAFGATREEAMEKAEALALSALADKRSLLNRGQGND